MPVVLTGEFCLFLNTLPEPPFPINHINYNDCSNKIIILRIPTDSCMYNGAFMLNTLIHQPLVFSDLRPQTLLPKINGEYHYNYTIYNKNIF